ncbi:ribonuclease P protein component [Granulicoccus phenolivorans]|uniref:ribonuclease P protein component n=1 Tax=Granulicoccus phenolivorans TaxID=266854 RepID=UPI00040887C9|nr:ribonuclease P protein component [Granulicoccus phenolivorans]
MLPSGHRMRSSQDFRATIRGGVRAGRATLVVHMVQTAETERSRVGFVVSKAVGNAVHRNRVKRRLRHLTRPLLFADPWGCTAVVRALPAAADADAELAADLVGAWQSCRRKLARRAVTAGSAR